MISFACSPAYVELSLVMGARCGPRRPCAVCRIVAQLTAKREAVLAGHPLLAIALPFPWGTVAAELLAAGRYSLTAEECREVVEEHKGRRGR